MEETSKIRYFPGRLCKAGILVFVLGVALLSVPERGTGNPTGYQLGGSLTFYTTSNAQSNTIAASGHALHIEGTGPYDDQGSITLHRDGTFTGALSFADHSEVYVILGVGNELQISGSGSPVGSANGAITLSHGVLSGQLAFSYNGNDHWIKADGRGMGVSGQGGSSSANAIALVSLNGTILLKSPIFSPPSSPSSFTIAPIAAEVNPPVVLTGTGFGSFTPTLPFTGNSQYLQVFDKTANWSAGYGADFCSVHITKWTNSKIELVLDVGGRWNIFCPLTAGDQLTVTVYPQNSSSMSANAVSSSMSADTISSSMSANAVAQNVQSLLLTSNQAYVAFDQQQAQNLLDNIETALGFSGSAILSIVPEQTINTNDVKILTDLIDLPEIGSSAVDDFETLGPEAIGFMPATSGAESPPSLPVLVAQEANTLVSTIYVTIAQDEKKTFVPGSQQCDGYSPHYILGPGVGLQITLLGSDSISIPKDGNIIVPASFDYLNSANGPGGLSVNSVPICSVNSSKQNYSQQISVQTYGMGNASVVLEPPSSNTQGGG